MTNTLKDDVASDLRDFICGVQHSAKTITSMSGVRATIASAPDDISTTMKVLKECVRLLSPEECAELQRFIREMSKALGDKRPFPGVIPD